MNVHKNARARRLIERGLYGRGRFASGLIVIAAKDWQVCRIARPGSVLEHSHKPVQTIILSRS
jgi:hypothetical protein